MLTRPPECHGCPLDTIGEGYAPPEGNGSYRVALIGEALGEHEAREGKPFRPGAPAGSMLDRLLRRAGLSRENFVIHNSIQCRPPRNWLENSPWEAGAVAHCAVHRARMFEDTRPKVFVALGNVALRALTSYGSGKTTISHVQGYVLDGPYDGTQVIGTFHPSALMQGLQGLSGVAIWAIQRAIDIAKHGFAREAVDVIAYPSLEDMLTFERGWSPENMRLDFDIETPESGELDEEDLAEEDDEEAPKRDVSYTIIRASLCYGGHAISFPWQSPYREVATRMLGRAVRAGVWNEDFDVPRLRVAGAPVMGRIYDFMKLWKHLQPNLPTKLKCRSLEFVTPFYWHTAEPWKHLNHGQPEFYNACDAIALSKCGDGIERDLRAKGQWDLFERHVIDCYQVLTKMAANGLPYDSKRAAEFEQELTTKFDERNTRLQEVVPTDLKRPKQKEGYKKPPKADDARTAALQLRIFKVLGQDMTEGEVATSGQALISPFEIYDVARYCLVEPFNPGSPGEAGQVADLIRHYGHKVGTNRKTKKGTVDDDTLKKLQKKLRSSHKPRDVEFAGVLQIVRECRQLKKVLGTYVGGWQPGRDGRIHATPGYWGRMFRISWRRPNISATIQDKDEEYIASGFRKCVAVPDGHLLIESDWKGIEAVLCGWFAGDEEYMRLARLGVHDYVTWLVLADKGRVLASDVPDLAWSDADLKRAFKEVKKLFPKDRDDCKHIVHGSNYLGTARYLAELYELREALVKEVQASYFARFDKLRKWQFATLERASKECKLRNPFGYEMTFWEVQRWDSKYKRWTLGEDAKSAIAFLPRDTAAAMLKEVLLRLRPLAEEGVLLASTHDSLTCETEEARVMEVAHLLKREMEAPVRELGGLVIGVEVKAGVAWHDSLMEVLDLEKEEVPHAIVA